MKRVPVSVLGTLVGVFCMSIGTAYATPVAIGSTASPLSGSSGSVVPGEDPVFDFSFSGTGGQMANGYVNASLLSDGNYLANSGAITITDGTDVGTYSLVPGASDGSAVNIAGNAGWYFTYDDNVLSGPSLDLYGLLFSNGAIEMNLFNNGTTYEFSGLHEGAGTTLDFDSTGSLTPVPEPASMALLGSGLLLMVHRRRRQA